MLQQKLQEVSTMSSFINSIIYDKNDYTIQQQQSKSLMAV